MSNQYKRKIKVVTIKQSFYNLFDEDSEIMQTIAHEGNARPCLILVKLTYKNNIHTFAIPFRSNIGNAPKGTYFPLPKRSATRDGRRHGLHYSKMFPITEKYMTNYKMGGDFLEELVMTYVEKNIKQIYTEASQYLNNYENGYHELYSVNIDEVLEKIK